MRNARNASPSTFTAPPSAAQPPVARWQRWPEPLNEQHEHGERFRLVCLHRSAGCATCGAFLEALRRDSACFVPHGLELLDVECSEACRCEAAEGSEFAANEALVRNLDLPCLLIPMWRAYLRSARSQARCGEECVPRLFLVTPERTLFECATQHGLPKIESILAATATLRGSAPIRATAGVPGAPGRPSTAPPTAQR